MISLPLAIAEEQAGSVKKYEVRSPTRVIQLKFRCICLAELARVTRDSIGNSGLFVKCFAALIQHTCNVFYNSRFTMPEYGCTMFSMIARLRDMIMSIIMVPAREYVVVRNRK